MHLNSMQLLEGDLLLVSITFPASTIHHGDDKSSFALWKIPDHDLVQDSAKHGGVAVHIFQFVVALTATVFFIFYLFLFLSFHLLSRWLHTYYSFKTAQYSLVLFGKLPNLTNFLPQLLQFQNWYSQCAYSHIIH